MKCLLFISIIFIIISMTINAQPDKQTTHNFEKEIKLTLSANYLLYLPKNYEESNETFPVVLFLHGAGERGTDIEKVKVHGLPRLIKEGKDFPFIVVSPQCPDNMFWSVELLAVLLDEIEANYKVDKNMIYVTGLSMGGHGTWSLAISQPNRFAAIAPVCGWSIPTMACKIKHVPIWVFHGAKDMVVPLSASEQMVDKLKSCNADVKFTVYPEANHDSWTETYNNDELYTWLLQHFLKKE